MNNLEKLNDDKIILIKHQWQTYKEIKTDISILKKYIDIYFGINSSIELRYYLNNNYSLSKQRIDIKILSPYPIITVNILFQLKYRYEDYIKCEYIQNRDVQNCIYDIMQELKEYIKNCRNELKEIK